MRQTRRSDFFFHLYMVVFLAYMLLPLIVMGGAALNDFALPLGLSLGRVHRPLVRRAVERRAHVGRPSATRCWWRWPSS